MSPEKSKELIAIYPSIFLEDDFYFECGDGWFDLLKDCITKIKEEIEANPLYLEEYLRFYVAQVKEKFGGLRFYSSLSTDAIRAIIDEAEARSEVTCETCGNAAHVRTKHGWAYTICDECVVKKS